MYLHKKLKTLLSWYEIDDQTLADLLSLSTSGIAKKKNGHHRWYLDEAYTIANLLRERGHNVSEPIESLFGLTNGKVELAPYR